MPSQIPIHMNRYSTTKIAHPRQCIMGWAGDGSAPRAKLTPQESTPVGATGERSRWASPSTRRTVSQLGTSSTERPLSTATAVTTSVIKTIPYKHRVTTNPTTHRWSNFGLLTSILRPYTTVLYMRLPRPIFVPTLCPEPPLKMYCKLTDIRSAARHAFVPTSPTLTPPPSVRSSCASASCRRLLPLGKPLWIPISTSPMSYRRELWTLFRASCSRTYFY